MSVGEYVCSQAAAVDQRPQHALVGESFEVGARLAEALTDALDVTDPEASTDKFIEVDAAGDDVPAGGGVLEGVPAGEGELIEGLGFDQS